VDADPTAPPAPGLERSPLSEPV
ncbi:aspartate 1-decarboxylase, partial [Clavibacter michiganensis subsp. insidiosus]